MWTLSLWHWKITSTSTYLYLGDGHCCCRPWWGSWWWCITQVWLHLSLNYNLLPIHFPFPFTFIIQLQLRLWYVSKRPYRVKVQHHLNIAMILQFCFGAIESEERWNFWKSCQKFAKSAPSNWRLKTSLFSPSRQKRARSSQYWEIALEQLKKYALSLQQALNIFGSISTLFLG